MLSNNACILRIVIKKKQKKKNIQSYQQEIRQKGDK